MNPRFLMKTHAQVRSPGIFSVLLARCTCPDRTSSADRVASCLADELRSAGRSFTAASKFAVLMAQEFGFLNSNMSWDSNGFVMHAVLTKCGKAHAAAPGVLLEPPYSAHERIGFLRYYLEADGALIWAIMKRIELQGELPVKELGADIARIFIDLYTQYLAVFPASRGRERVRSAIARLSRDQYDPGTIPHKVWPHIQPLIDLDVLSLYEKDGEQTIAPTMRATGPTTRLFAEELSTLHGLEAAFSDFQFFKVIARLLLDDWTPFDLGRHNRRLEEAVSEGYEVMKDLTTGMAHLNALCDWACVDLLATDAVVMERSQVREYVRQIYREQPRRLRFEVDFDGRPAFVVFQ